MIKPNKDAKRLTLSQKEADYIEGYAAALQELLLRLTGNNGCGKTYDPITIDLDKGIMHSYAFDMKDGGRHHSISDYDSLDEILKYLTNEVFYWIKEDLDLK